VPADAAGLFQQLFGCLMDFRCATKDAHGCLWIDKAACHKYAQRRNDQIVAARAAQRVIFYWPRTARRLLKLIDTDCARVHKLWKHWPCCSMTTTLVEAPEFSSLPP